jgi:dephospho-CoA kinase
VFGDQEKLRLLESIVHPEVAEMRRAFLADNAAAPLIVFDIPLLFEKTGQHGLDAVLVVSASAEQQRERVLARPGMTQEKFERILALQVPDAEKRARADYVIDTGVSLTETRHAVQQLVHTLTAAKK